MLENYAQHEFDAMKSLMNHLDNSMRHVREKLELRKNLNEKKEIAAKQFFELTFSELRRIEDEFWEDFQKDQEKEVILFEKLLEQYDFMNNQYKNIIKPMYEAMDEKINVSEFQDIIENRTKIWNLTDFFEKKKIEFYNLVSSVEDYELVFDKIECKIQLEEYRKK